MGCIESVYKSSASRDSNGLFDGGKFYGIKGASGYYMASWPMLLLQLNIGHISNQQEYNRSMMRRHFLFFLF